MNKTAQAPQAGSQPRVAGRWSKEDWKQTGQIALAAFVGFQLAGWLRTK